MPRMEAAIALLNIGDRSPAVLDTLRAARDDTGAHLMIRFHAGNALVRLTGEAKEAVPEHFFRNTQAPAADQGRTSDK